jgi:hypothetical protein
LIHLSTTCVDGAENDFKPFVETFFKEDIDAAESADDCTRPTIIYAAYFEVPSSIKGYDYVQNQNGPIYSCCGPFNELDYDESIRQSRLLYQKLYPEDEFLPKAPEPEEIIIGDEDATESNINLGVLADLITPETSTNKESDANAESIPENVQNETQDT